MLQCWKKEYNETVALDQPFFKNIYYHDYWVDWVSKLALLCSYSCIFSFSTVHHTVSKFFQTSTDLVENELYCLSTFCKILDNLRPKSSGLIHGTGGFSLKLCLRLFAALCVRMYRTANISSYLSKHSHKAVKTEPSCFFFTKNHGHCTLLIASGTYCR